MSMEIITGYTGIEHVTSADDASLYRGILGQDDYVLEVGSKFAATIIDNNTVRVADGDLVIQGHQARIRANDYNEVTIDNGTPGEKRNDLIVARYIKDTDTGIESITLEVIKGTPGATATDPEIIQGDLTVGSTQRDLVLYRVTLNGLVLESVTNLFSTIPNLKILKTHINRTRTTVTDGGGASLFPYSYSLIILYAVDKDYPGRHLLAIGYRGAAGTTHHLNVVKSEGLTLGAANNIGTQVINGGGRVVAVGISVAQP